MYFIRVHFGSFQDVQIQMGVDITTQITTFLLLKIHRYIRIFLHYNITKKLIFCY